ncbi:MAG: UDP-galactopyranose mutase [Eggerthellaceae bacterium]|jgi:UDP-galactopyranose mutase
MTVRYKSLDEIDIEKVDAVVVGAGFAGSVIARELAERGQRRVLIIEKRDHIGGNMHDYYNSDGILIHAYGPHIFHTNNKRVFDYILRFTDWHPYEHRVLANWFGTYMPVPFNKNSIEIAFGEAKAGQLIHKLVETFGNERKVTLNELRKEEDPELSEIADFVYKNVFLYYTQKQWGLTPDEVDPSVTARVPVFISRDNRYFQDEYQGLPADGYHVLFDNLLSHPNISVVLETEAESVFDLNFESRDSEAPLESISIKGKYFDKPIIFTGPLDELFLSQFGRLPYRTLNFVYETHPRRHVLPCGTVNYTVTEEYTRITEFTYLTGQDIDRTTTCKEYSLSYEDPVHQIPYYAIISDENREHYERYHALTRNLDNFYLLGRLAEYRYYNMDVIIERALNLADEIIGTGEKR